VLKSARHPTSTTGLLTNRRGTISVIDLKGQGNEVLTDDRLG
jgi:hypothetical protein